MLNLLEWLERKDNLTPRKIRYWCQDETRLGLKTIERKRITAYGVKPIGKVQWKFSAYTISLKLDYNDLAENLANSTFDF